MLGKRLHLVFGQGRDRINVSSYAAHEIELSELWPEAGGRLPAVAFRLTFAMVLASPDDDLEATIKVVSRRRCPIAARACYET